MGEFFNGYNEDIKVSKYNPAALKMSRIDDYTKIINQAKLNPKAYNLELSEWNFNLWLRGIDILYAEIQAKLSDDEQKDCLKLKSAIEYFMRNNEVLYDSDRTKNGKKIKIDDKVFNVLKSFLEKYELKVRGLQDIHGLDTPNMDDEEGL